MRHVVNLDTELTKEEFESRLKELVAEGEPLIMGSPFAIFTVFGDTSKPFLGEFTKTEYRITRNSILPLSHTGYTLKGKYFGNDKGKITIEYALYPIWFLHIGTRVMPLLFFILINITFYMSGEAKPQSYVIANLFLIMVLFLAIKLDLMTKRNLEKRFQRDFGVNS